MAWTTTFLNSAAGASDTNIVLSAFTNPSLGAISPPTLLKFTTGEICLVTSAVNSPTLAVVRGYYGTRAVAHNLYEGITYGLSNDSTAPPLALFPPQAAVIEIQNTQEITATGTTGTNAGVITIPSPGYLTVTGASGAGVNLPVPTVGSQYWMKNMGTGILKVYCVGGTISALTGAITGTTGALFTGSTGTGNLTMIFQCSTAGAWQIAPVESTAS